VAGADLRAVRDGLRQAGVIFDWKKHS
jgi:hypothetical protein